MNRIEKTHLAGLIALPIGISTIALALLSTPPTIACYSIDASAAVSIRLYCAQQQAQRDTPESLAAAIDLLENVPIDDPYYQQTDRFVQHCSNQLLEKAETEVQAGNLEQGISMMRTPRGAKLPLHQEAKVRSWKSLWEKGEALMKTALTQMEQREWQQAFQTASQLRQFENEYWAVEQYNSLIKQIQSDREFRDWKLKSPIELDKTPKEIEFNQPKPEKIAHSTRPLWKPQDNSPIPRSVIEQRIEPPKPKIQPKASPIQPSSEPTEPPTPQFQQQLKTPVSEPKDSEPESKDDRT